MKDKELFELHETFDKHFATPIASLIGTFSGRKYTCTVYICKCRSIFVSSAHVAQAMYEPWSVWRMTSKDIDDTWKRQLYVAVRCNSELREAWKNVTDNNSDWPRISHARIQK